MTPQNERILAERLRLAEAERDKYKLELSRAEQRERIARETYEQQQGSHRELEALYQAMTGRAERAEADYAMLRAVARRCFGPDAPDSAAPDLWYLVTIEEHPGRALIVRYNKLKEIVRLYHKGLPSTAKSVLAESGINLEDDHA